VPKVGSAQTSGAGTKTACLEITNYKKQITKKTKIEKIFRFGKN